MRFVTNFSAALLPIYRKAIENDPRFEIQSRAYDIKGKLVYNCFALHTNATGDLSDFWRKLENLKEAFDNKRPPFYNTIMKTLPPKFIIRVYTQEHSAAVQNRLFSMGIGWLNGDKKASESPIIAYGDQGCLFIEGKFLSYSDLAYFLKSHPRVPFITLDDLYKLKMPNVETVVLNSQHSAEVSLDGIKVGCQTFPLDIVEKLVAAKEKVLGGD